MGIPTFRITRDPKNRDIVMTKVRDTPPFAAVPDGLVGQWYWHIHHDMIAQPLTEPLRARIGYINTEKPADERAIRLAAISPVRGKLPPDVIIAGVAAVAASQAAKRLDAAARAKSPKFWEWMYAVEITYRRLRRTINHHIAELEVLHGQEHPSCTWAHGNIFGRKGY